MKPHSHYLAVGLCFATLFGLLSARAATTSVNLVDCAFNPPSVTIKVGDTVTWTNPGIFPHTSTSDVCRLVTPQPINKSNNSGKPRRE